MVRVMLSTTAVAMDTPVSRTVSWTCSVRDSRTSLSSPIRASSASMPSDLPYPPPAFPPSAGPWPHPPAG